MTKDYVKVSKFLSYVLRHKPDAIGLELDAEGWASVDELIEKAPLADMVLDRPLIADVVATNDEKRFRLSDDQTLIRASQGHSIEIDLGLKPAAPPDILYHGTATRFLDSILAQGLLPKARQFVHLSADQETATKVGARHGKPVVLIIDARKMSESDVVFYQADNGVWLTAHVATEFIAQA